MRSHVKIAVIGGGVVGCSVLYHLTKLGCKDVVLLERDELTSGSSWHAAGGIHTHNSDVNMSKLQKYTIEIYKELEEISEQKCSVHLTGGIMVADSKERFDFLKLAVDLGKSSGIERDLISMDEAKKLFPLIEDTSHFYGAMYEKHDGHLDPSGVTNAYAKAARIQGAEIYRKTCVKEIIPQSQGGFNLVTDQGTIYAEQVVNAGGLWAREVGRMVGIELPLLAMEHHYIITDTIPLIEKMEEEIIHCVDFGAEIYMRQEHNGLLLGTYEKQATPWSTHQTPWDFGHELLNPNLDRIEPSLRLAFERYPAIGEVGIKRVINGPFTFAPDGNPLLGPVRGVPGFWSACAVMAGFSQGGGVGLALANWMLEGDPGLDVFAMDVSRFGEYATLPYTNAKVKENYSKRFSITYPTEELPAARNIRRTALYDRQKSNNAVFTVAHGLEQVKYYALSAKDSVEEHTFRRSESFDIVAKEVKNTRENVGLFDISGFAKYEVKGPGAAEWLDTIMANNLPKTHRLVLSPMLNYNGNIIGDLTIAKLKKDHFMLFGSGPCEEFHMRWFEQHLPKNGVEVRSLFSAFNGLSISGPHAHALLSACTYENIAKDVFSFLDIKPLIVGNIPTLTARVSFTGELGYEIWVKPEYLLSLYEQLTQAGKEFGLQSFGLYALNSMRIEKSFGSYLREYKPDYNPIEAGLGRFVSKKKDHYIGAEATRENRAKKQEKKLCTLLIHDAPYEAHPYMPLTDQDNALLGFVTSSGYGHYVNKSLAMGYVSSDHVQVGNKVKIHMMMERYDAEIIKNSPFDPQAERMRQTQ